MIFNNLTNTQLKNALKASAILDQEICAEAWLRCFTYQENWAEGVDIAQYDNGAGDHVVIIFKEQNLLIKGFDHESPVSPHAQKVYAIWDGMYDGAPKDLLEILTDEALEYEDVTFCYWRTEESGLWMQGNVIFKNNEKDGSEWLLSALTVTLEKYLAYAKAYFTQNASNISEQRIFEVFESAHY